MGIIIGFDDLSGGPLDRRARAQMLMDEAALAGASISRIQADWGGLESSAGAYDDTALAELLAEARARGQQVFFTLSTLDSNALTVPADLVDVDGRFRPGLSLASPELQARFEAFLDWLVPRLGDEVWALALGNEVDAAIEDGFASDHEALLFYRLAAERIATLEPDLATTVTLTLAAPEKLPAFTRDLLEALDIATFNHYCLDTFLQVTGPDRWAADAAQMKDTAGELPIMIQELGCPTGYGDDGVGAPARPANGLMGSPTIQLEYFEYFRNVFTDDPQFRAATVFQLYDWSPALARRFGDLVRAEGATLIGNRLEEWLATVGVCRWADGSCRPAWDAFLETLRAQDDARDAAAD